MYIYIIRHVCITKHDISRNSFFILSKNLTFDSCATLEEYNQRVSAAIDFTAKLRKSLRSAKLETGFYHNNQDLTKQLREVARLISTRTSEITKFNINKVNNSGLNLNLTLAFVNVL